MRIARRFLLVFLLASPARPQIPPPGNARQADSFKISVDVNLVLLHATVTERRGLGVTALRQQDFDVFEDGVRQTIRLFSHEDIPVTVGLVIDHSGSMRPKLAEVIAAAMTFAQSSNPADEMFVVNFNETVSLGLPGTIPFAGSIAELESAIWRAPAEGQTALYDAVAAALSLLRNGVSDKKALIIISDGGDNASARTLSQVLRLVEQSNAIIYAIGVFDPDDPDRNPRVLHQLAQATGGEAFFPAELDELKAICLRIAQDLRSQYTIGYLPVNTARDGAYRTIRVVARAAGYRNLHVRTRRGYTAASEPGLKGDGAK